MKWWHLVLIFVLITIIVISFTKYYNDNHQVCGAAFTFGINKETGQCKYFSSTCLDKGYSYVNVMECDCNNLEPYNLDQAETDCKLNQGLINRDARYCTDKSDCVLVCGAGCWNEEHNIHGDGSDCSPGPDPCACVNNECTPVRPS
ncbi:hypothetical protein HON86_01555 [Candidatus Woesearchaeota archaeon]|jgi:hypothetical protein|nr:hypothetical protein [Candidatus Woesearchaeota archaeon]